MIITPSRVIPAHASSAATSRLELSCKVSCLASMREAVDSGADLVYIPHHCMGTGKDIADADLHSAFEREVIHAHSRHCKVALSIDDGPDASNWDDLRKMLGQAASSSIDALMLPDYALLLYATAHHPELPRYFALPEGVIDIHIIDAIQRQAAITRIVLPHLVFLPQLEQLSRHLSLDIEVIGFGRNCTFTEEQPEDHVLANEEACGDALELLPRLKATGIQAVRIEADEGSNSLSHVTRMWRETIDRHPLLRQQAGTQEPFDRQKIGVFSC